APPSRPAEGVKLPDQGCYFVGVEQVTNLRNSRATRYLARCQARHTSFGHAPGSANCAGALFFGFAGKVYCWRRTLPAPKKGRTIARNGRSHSGPGRNRTCDLALRVARSIRLSYGAVTDRGRSSLRPAFGLLWSRLSGELLTVPLLGETTGR